MIMKRIITLLVMTTVLLSALHVVLAHDFALRSDPVVLSAVGADGQSPAHHDKDERECGCVFCHVVSHAVAPAPAILIKLAARETRAPALHLPPRATVADPRLRPPRIAV
jgi:hypothetical protein